MKSSTSATITKIKTFVTSLQANVFMRRITKKKASLFFAENRCQLSERDRKNRDTQCPKIGERESLPECEVV